MFVRSSLVFTHTQHTLTHTHTHTHTPPDLQPTLGVATPKHAKMYVIASQVGAYFPEGFQSVALIADKGNVRAWPGGTGEYKIGGWVMSTRNLQLSPLYTITYIHVTISFAKNSLEVNDCDLLEIMHRPLLRLKRPTPRAIHRFVPGCFECSFSRPSELF